MAAVQTARERKASESRAQRKKLQYAAAFCLVFMFVEIVGGIIAGSIAVMTDAAHMLADVGGLLVGIFAQSMVER